MSLRLEDTSGENSSRSFFNAYIPVIALLLAFFMAVPQFVPRFISPTASEPLFERRLLTATIPLRANGRARPTRRLQEIVALAKLHRFSASLSYSVYSGMSYEANRILSEHFDSPVYRRILAKSIPKLRLSIIATTTGTQ